MATKKKNPNTQTSEVVLDPQQEAMVKKLRRMAVFSTILMIGGFLAVFAVIAYRLSNMPAPQAAAIPAITNALPKGSRVVSTAVSEGRIVVTIERDGVTEMRVFDLSTLQLRGSLRLEPQ